MKIKIFFVLVLIVFLVGCQNEYDEFMPANGDNNESNGYDGGVSDYYFCESSSDCWDIESLVCSLENIDLSHDYKEINSSVAESANYNHVGQVCYENRCYCQGNWYTTYD